MTNRDDVRGVVPAGMMSPGDGIEFDVPRNDGDGLEVDIDAEVGMIGGDVGFGGVVIDADEEILVVEEPVEFPGP